MAAMYTAVVLIATLSAIFALPEPGKWESKKTVKKGDYFQFNKSVYKDTLVSLTLTCTPNSASKDIQLRVGWVLRYSPCSEEYQNIEGNDNEDQILRYYYANPALQLYPDFGYKDMEFIKFYEVKTNCDGHVVFLPDETSEKPTRTHSEAPDESLNTTKLTDDLDNARRRREENDTKSTTKPATTTVTSKSDSKSSEQSLSTLVATSVTETVQPVTTKKVPMSLKIDDHHIAKVWKSGFYILVLSVEPSKEVEVDVTVTVSMKGPVGYISALEWPLLIFYGIMGLVYILFGLIWLLMLACNWRDLLRLQYWVGAVIFLGMLEKAVFYSDYQSVASSGNSFTEGAIVFAEIISSLKRGLARMLVIIVSHGFGIVKPRLGQTLHRVLAVGALYTILATVEGCMRSLKPKSNQNNGVLYAAGPLAILDAFICYWVFHSLVQTLRQLRLRRNIVKLQLYRHFANTLIFAVIASIVFIIWSIIAVKTKVCLTNWHELWIDEAFWHLLFSVLLLAIMILWRPSSNNQRYAFSPLLDAGDDDEEEEETVMNDAFEGMKMRGKQANGSPKQKQNTIEDDLKWVEENIPSAISDKAETLLESDEEVMTAKYEMSKMQ